MYRYISGQDIPQTLTGPLLIDDYGLPRYWSTVWSTLSICSLEPSTQTHRLRLIESLYCFADELNGCGSLDDMLGSLDMNGLGQVLEAFFVSIHNRPVNANSEMKWRTALGFVTSVLMWRSKGDVQNPEFQSIQKKLSYLETLYSQLRISKPRQPNVIRSLPANVLEALFELLSPDSSTNPFRNDKTRWRVFLIFTMLLNMGLRRGELLILPVDTVKNSFDNKSQRTRHWINVTENPYGQDDVRYNKPSIKTANSYRQIPVNEATSILVQSYIENFRGRPEHSFLVNSQFNSPMSHEALTKLFSKISMHLPKIVMKELEDRTGKKSITPHDLRHTCAVVFLNQLLKMGDSMDEALAKMRIFFGWAPSSDMPLRYARAVFEDRLANVWSKIFDDQTEILRAIPKGL